MDKEIILVGDKILVKVLDDEGKTESGLYLPQGVKEKEKVAMGRIIKTGPGYPIFDPAILDQEPWTKNYSRGRYFPLQAQEGDICIFAKEHCVEVELEKEKYLVIPHSAILILIRDKHFLEELS